MRRVLASVGALALVALAAASWFTLSQDEERLRDARETMVRTQLLGRGIANPAVLEAMRRVRRHAFVPASLRPLAYEDRPLPIGAGQTITQPYVVALMTELLKPVRGMKVLEVGTGSGYQAAVLAAAGCQVYSMEIMPELALSAEKALRAEGFGDVKVRHGNGWLGWPEAAPFDAILVTCAPDAVPPALVAQLAEGGHLVIPVGAEHAVQNLTLIGKRDGRVQTDEILPVTFVPMAGAPAGGAVTAP